MALFPKNPQTKSATKHRPCWPWTQKLAFRLAPFHKSWCIFPRCSHLTHSWLANWHKRQTYEISKLLINATFSCLEPFEYIFRAVCWVTTAKILCLRPFGPLLTGKTLASGGASLAMDTTPGVTRSNRLVTSCSSLPGVCFLHHVSTEYIFKVATVIHSQSSTQRLKAVAFPACPALHFGRSRWIRVNLCQFDIALFDFTKYMQGSLSSSSSSTAFNLHYSYLEGVPSMVAVYLWCLYKLQTPSLRIDGWFNLSNSPAKSLPAKAARPWEALHWKH